MLQRFLESIESRDVQSIFEIARRLNVTPGMVVQMAEDLSKRGYLQEVSIDCSKQGAACEGCPARKGCLDISRSWMMNEKGRAALSCRD